MHEAPSTAPLVSLRGVSKSFMEAGEEHAVLTGIDLDVESGDFVALLGRSGTGKSTLLNLISGIDLPDGGDVLISGRAINRLSERDRTLFRRRDVGFVFQFFQLLPTLTVLENVMLPLQLNAAGDAEERAMSLLTRVGLASRAATFADRLSGGEQQRVAVARALAHDPDILLADEPTGNLDVDIGREVMMLLDELARDRGKTLIVATHSHEVARQADAVYRIIDHGLRAVPKDDL